jgi:hypothetical protein
MKKLIGLLALSVLVGCSSAPKYALMPTIESKLDDTDHVIKDGMAITKKGAVLDIKIEEVQEQKKRLQEEIFNKDLKIKYLTERNLELETNMKILRSSFGMSPDAPKPTHHGFTPEGNLVGFKRAKTLSEEIVDAKHGRAPSMAIPVVVTDIEPVDGDDSAQDGSREGN